MKNFKKLLALSLILNTSFALSSIKDPGLIGSVEYKKPCAISTLKRSFDNKREYSKYKQILSKEEMDIYIVADRIIRANNLQYKNWRIGFKLDKDVINAVLLNNNLILINSSLYDCIHQNKDALAFVVAHELAHFVLSHQKVTLENNYKIKKLEENIKKIEEYSLKTGKPDNFSRNLKNLVNNIYITQRNLEFSADAEALEMLIRAGYDYKNSLEVFEYVDEDYLFFENKNAYPLIYERIDNINSQADILDFEKLNLEGQNNLITSTPLSTQKSMDKETLVINKPQNYKDYSYKLQTRNEKILSKAYSFYKKEDFQSAIKYFLMAYNEAPNSYIAPLYLSYCYQKEGDIKLSKRYIRKAKSLKAKDPVILEQYRELYKN